MQKYQNLCMVSSCKNTRICAWWVCAKIPEFKHSNSVADLIHIDFGRIAVVFRILMMFGLRQFFTDIDLVRFAIFFVNIDKVRILLVFLSNIYSVRIAVIFCKYWCCSECGSFFADIFVFSVFLQILMGFGLRYFFANIDRILIAKVFFCKYWGGSESGIFCDSLGSSSLAG